MMRQTKATIATWGVAVVLVAGLLMFGCTRQTGHNGEAEHGHDGGHADKGGHGHDDSSMGETMHAPEPTGTLNGGVRIVELKARKFAFDPATIVVKQGEKVRLQVTSEDVMHGIGIADYGIDQKLPSNGTQVIEFTADKPGKHHFHCSVYCGDGHGDMHGELEDNMHPGSSVAPDASDSLESSVQLTLVRMVGLDPTAERAAAV